MRSEDLKSAIDVARYLPRKSGDDLSKLPLPVATLLTVVGAQGVIDNGGYRYFFEADWPGTPDDDVFIEAYRRVGCKKTSRRPIPRGEDVSVSGSSAAPGSTQ